MRQFKIYFKGFSLVFFSQERSKEGHFFEINKNSTAKQIKEKINYFLEERKNIFIHSNLGEEEIIQKITAVYDRKFAAGGIVKNTKNKYLGIYRNKIWDFPKGHIEKRETPEMGALREVSEECGISIKKLTVSGHLKDSYYFISKGGEYFFKKVSWYEMYYSGNETPQPQEEEGIEKVEWLGKEKMKRYYINTFPTIQDLMFDCIL